MMIWRRGKVISLGAIWSESVELKVEIKTDANDRCANTDDGKIVKALAYLPIVGMPAVGDIVILSASAVKRGLGTGGYLFVVANATSLPADSPAQPGHLVKARYTPSQFMVQGVEEQESSYHAKLAQADTIDEMPVICADLHSSLPAIVLGLKAENPACRIAYIMTDGAALPAWFSQLAAKMKNDGMILGTISCGQAFGGELEAVNVYTALLAAKNVWNADVAVVAQGPGNLGTGTKWGFSGTQIGEALNAAGILGGRPVAVLRLSNADLRSRHYGISHHSIRILQDLVTTQCTVPVPSLAELVTLESDTDNALLPLGFTQNLKKQITVLAQKSNLNLVENDFRVLLPILQQHTNLLKTMGRSYHQEASAFIAAAVAGKYAAKIC